MEKLRAHIEQVVSLSDKEFDLIQSLFVSRKVKKHQYLIQEGDSVNNEFWIVKGCFRVFSIDEAGKEHILQFAVENWWMSDYSAFFQQKKANVNAISMEDGEVLSISLQNKEKLCAEMHKMEHFFRLKLVARLGTLQQRIATLLSGTPQQRYQEFASMYPHLLQRIPKKFIAEYLGVSRETLSRLYSK